jgi:CheY-like chemotaxis protein
VTETVARTILIVDDDPDIIESVAEVLRFAGYKVLTALGGEEALRALAPNHWLIHLVLLDLVMAPGMSGTELYERMLADPQLAQIPVVFHSANAVDAPGGVAVLQKPASMARLLKIVRKHRRK